MDQACLLVIWIYSSLMLRVLPTVMYYCHTRLHLGFSAKLRIEQESSCKMEPRSGIIFGQDPTRPDPTRRVSLSQLLLTRFWWNFIGRFHGISRTGFNCHGTFVQATFVLVTFVHIRNISAVTDSISTKLSRKVFGTIFNRCQLVWWHLSRQHISWQHLYISATSQLWLIWFWLNFMDLMFKGP